MSLLIQLLIRLRHAEVLLLIRRHIHDLVSYHRHIAALIHLTIRRLDKSIYIDPGIGSQGVDQTDVRSFWRLYRTHSSIMRIVNVSNLKSGTVSGQTAGTQGRQTALMRQLRQRVVLIHELR